MENENENQSEKEIFWFETVPCNILDPYQESKPRLSQEEIEKAAKVHSTFVDPRNQMKFGWVLEKTFHRETYWEFWRLTCRNNRNPVDHPYSVDQYIIDKGIGKENCNNEECGSCECE
tara:strand:+ start:1102 stop:1455 length:354 start_codon:yes stop_codon:yes gene_type:complete